MSTIRLRAIIVLLGCMTILTACGGGSGGSASSSLTYSGVVSQAIVTQDNADDIAAAALSAGTSGSAIGVAFGSMGSATASSLRPAVIFGIASLFETVERLDVTSYPMNRGTSEALVSYSDSFSGSCGGVLSISIQYDDVTAAFNGSMNFYDYCEYDETMNGSASFSGLVDLGTEEFVDMTISLHRLTSTTAVTSYTLDGTVSYDLSSSSGAIVMNILVRNNLSGQVFRLESYTVELEDLGTGYRLTMNGRFYHPDFGYVVVYTASPLLSGYDDLYPSAGQLVMLGDASAARLTALDAGQCRIEVDGDGDGDYSEYDSGAIPWSSL